MHILVNAMKRKVKTESEKSEAGRYDELDAAVARIPRIVKRNADGVVILPDDWDDPRDAVYDDYRVFRITWRTILRQQINSRRRFCI